jgi:hypothetical protein
MLLRYRHRLHKVLAIAVTGGEVNSGSPSTINATYYHGGKKITARNQTTNGKVV